MYQAELQGKLSSRIERMEDILTSNVFSFFKYSTREIFLKGYLNRLGFDVSNQEANEAEFMFWPRFEENTEPDLVIIAGSYYLLIEAKYFSGFDKETEKTKGQLLREIEGGALEARNYSKDFKLIAITADSCYKENKFEAIPPEFRPHFTWTNWQTISSFLSSTLEGTRDISNQERAFAFDLYTLLDKKNLRGFQGLDILYDIGPYLGTYASVFFEARTARFRGAFIGFMEGLSFEKKIVPLKKTIFLSSPKKMFTRLSQPGKLRPIGSSIFYKGGLRS